jgi:hypothetical protein
MPDGKWEPAPPASGEALKALRAQASVPLPAAYLDQLASSNGGEGDLAGDPDPRWITFWPAETVLASNAAYSIPEFLPGFFGFATDGGGELYAFDTRAGEPYPVVMVPFVPLDAGEAIRLAKSFDEFRGLIGRQVGETV